VYTSDCTVLIPCYKENNHVVNQLYRRLIVMGFQVLVIDDGATMDLPEEIPQIRYAPNMGYGYALKRGIEKAETPFVLTMDGDGEHSPEDAFKVFTVFNMINGCDMVVGCRWKKQEKWFRWLARKAINFTASVWARHFLPDLNSGMRIFKKELAIGYSRILCDTFSFTTSLTMCLVTDGHKVAWFPIESNPRLFGKSHVKLLRDGLVTVWFIFWIGFALRTRGVRNWLRKFHTT